ncbi:MAG: carbon starvation protein A [Gemmatimonadales bacterium]|nr:carbon starvation protein A [Gemmatimonadales bacterium]NIN49126.1 carbon starvation protein A [Gemmatimonadales bacterium]NIP06590.1 carbon starvation protein A [Gemmatimonadales bacterium]NIR00287.1 carbon starvation protein A [Gemmatimonadales bacterium]NIS64620.1 carbon starvation protein A [Gemmatimonadales bacterium]
MSGIALLVVGLSAFLTGYLVYSRYIARHIYRLDPDHVTPAHEFQDGVDYVPTNRHVLFGHHFTSVAGAAPIVGPAIAVIWGWLPAFLWVVLGTVFAGAVHDFGTLWISQRHKGHSIGTLAERIVGGRARVLFLLIIFFLLLLVNAVFAVVIANLFIANHGAVLPVWGSLVVAVVVGLLIYRTGTRILWPSLGALAILYVLIWLGQYAEFSLPDFLGFGPTAAQLADAQGDAVAAQEAARTDGVRAGWVIILFVYAFFASVLPVWVLLQPRDYVNSHQLFVALGIIFLGVIVVNPEVIAPAINRELPADAPNWFPLLFITIACGAISGFHGLVASGTSAKQLNKETDARYVGYGGMIGEGTLALTSILATTAGFALVVGVDGWHEHYGSWARASSGATAAFVNGVGRLAQGIGIPQEVAVIFAAVVVISFAATTMDTGVRLQRYIISELGAQYRVKLAQNRWMATFVAVASCALLALGVDRGAGGMRLWPLFGTTNQLTGALSLLVVTLFLVSLRRRIWVTFVPMAFLIFMTTWAMILNLVWYFTDNQVLLLGVGGVIFVLELWLIFEAAAAVKQVLERRAGRAEGEGAISATRAASGNTPP